MNASLEEEERGRSAGRTRAGASWRTARRALLCGVAVFALARGAAAGAPTNAPAQTPWQGVTRAPTRIAIDATGSVYVTDSRAGGLYKLSAAGGVLATKTNLWKPLGVAVGNRGLVYVGEEGFGRVSVYSNNLAAALYTLGGVVSNEFQLPNHIAVDTTQSNGWIYVCDSRAHQIRCYSTSTLVRTFGTKGSGNGQFDFPAGVYVSAVPEVYVVDQNNDRVQVFSSTGGFVRAFSLRVPADLVTTTLYGRAQGIVGDNYGRLYVADAFQDEVKVFDTNGVYLATIGGWGEWTGQLRSPGALALHDTRLTPDLHLYVASMNNNRLEYFLVQGGGAVYVTLQVVSPWGTPVPAVRTYTNLFGSVLTNTVNLVDARGLTQYVNMGWTMTGNTPVAGSSNLVVLSHTNSAVLTWLWKTQYNLTVSVAAPVGGPGPNGTASAPTNWWDAGATATATAVSNLYYHFTVWTGTVSSSLNPLPILMSGAQSVTANFEANLATNGAPEWWLASYNLTNQAFHLAAVGDQDADGVVTWQEYFADTIPTNSASFLGFSRIGSATGGTSVAWHGGVLATQYLEKSAGLLGTQAVWQSIFTNLPPTAISVAITNAAGADNALFFRIRAAR
jgi:hypothetical protein